MFSCHLFVHELRNHSDQAELQLERTGPFQNRHMPLMTSAAPQVFSWMSLGAVGIPEHTGMNPTLQSYLESGAELDTALGAALGAGLHTGGLATAPLAQVGQEHLFGDHTSQGRRWRATSTTAGSLWGAGRYIAPLTG